jgi:hypothetical protein
MAISLKYKSCSKFLRLALEEKFNMDKLSHLIKLFCKATFGGIIITLKKFKNIFMKIIKIIIISLLLLGLNINKASACACGCGIFNVGTSALLPNCAGGTAFVQYDYINQGRNWHNNDKSSLDENNHKQIRTQTITAGMQYMFNRKWGMALRVPYVERYSLESSSTETGGVGASHDGHHHDEEEAMTITSNSARTQKSIGDIRINAIYSGFSSDMSTGITFGLKLPTGDYKYKGFQHRDMMIGTGSTDLILGAYHFGKVDNEGKFNYFLQGSWQHAFITRDNYRIGDEFSGATGIYYNAGSMLGIKRVSPILQVTGSQRLLDSGANSIPTNSGYTQIFLAPAIELGFSSFKIYADIGFPIYQNVNGNQLVANRIYKVILGYNF